MQVSAVIVAAGNGSRMNLDKNKQYLDIDGIPVLARTLHVFNACSQIREIILVVHEAEMIFCKKNMIEAFDFNKVTQLVRGGATRQASVYQGLKAVTSQCEVVMVHDGARPFIREKSLLESIQGAKEHGAACVAVPVKDTVKRANAEGLVQETLERSTLWSVQTPQTFRYSLIMEAHEKALLGGFVGTDDAVLVERLGYPLKLIAGDYYNIKITTREDLVLAEAIAKSFIME